MRSGFPQVIPIRKNRPPSSRLPHPLKGTQQFLRARGWANGDHGDVNEGFNYHEGRIWELAARTPAKNLRDQHGVPVRHVAKGTVKAMRRDRLPSIAAELGFWFAFAIFPALVCATAIPGLAARPAAQVYSRLLDYPALVVPNSALDIVLHIFHQTADHSGTGMLTPGLLAAVWFALVGISAGQDAINAVYKLEERRPCFRA